MDGKLKRSIRLGRIVLILLSSLHILGFLSSWASPDSGLETGILFSKNALNKSHELGFITSKAVIQHGITVNPLDLTLVVTNTLNISRTNEPVTSGVPIPRELNLKDLSTLRLLDSSGYSIPAQFTPLARWGGVPDNTSQPIRWLLLDFQVNIPAQGTATYRLVNSGGVMPTFPMLVVREGADAITIDTGVAIFSINKSNGGLNGPHFSSPLQGRAKTPSGAVYFTTGPINVTVALSGPMRTSIHVKGSYRDAMGTSILSYNNHYWFYAGQSNFRLFHTVENNNLCPLGGYEQLECYDIGSGGSVDIADISLVISTALGGSLTYQTENEISAVSGSLTDSLTLYQDSSGTDHWNHYQMMTDGYGHLLDTRPRMQADVTFRGYRTTLGTMTIDNGNHSAGWLRIGGMNGSWTVGVRNFWQNFPKALRAKPDGTIEIGLLPDEFGPAGYRFNLRAGEHKTHEIGFSFSSSNPPFFSLSPLFARASPQWYTTSGAFGLTALRNWADWPDHENYLNYQLETSPDYASWMNWYPNLLAAIEATDFYGMFDFGDWPIDYEGYGVAPLNTKYDNNLGMWLQWVRSGDDRWFHLAEAANRHLADIDILHNLHNPRHWGDGIAFGHSYHDEEGFINPHRNYGGNHPDTAFGVSGLLFTYYLTGYEKAYSSAFELADCIEYRLHNDGHLCGFFPPGECSGEGYGLGESGGLYENGSRPAANSLSIVVEAYRANTNPRYLAVADAMVDWARASHQPYINGPTGQDQMVKPWMLNLYLRALANYLEMRDEFGLADTYDGKGSFLAFTDWLHTYAWLELNPIDTGPRATYPYEWWFDGRIENSDPSISNWLLLGSDVMAYAHHLSGISDYLEWATRLFRTGARDPWYEGDENTYSSTKETINSITFGHLFLHEFSSQNHLSTLTIQKSGMGSGTVTSIPAGIQCGTDCSGSYPPGTVVTLTATPDDGSSFTEWNGGGCSGTGPCVVTMNADTSLTAIFNLSSLYELSGIWSNLSEKRMGLRYRISGRLTVHNSGIQRASRIIVRFYLSDNATYETDDRYLGYKTFHINAGSSASTTASYIVSIDPQGKFLIGLIDPDNQIEESDENNNIVVSNGIP